MWFSEKQDFRTVVLGSESSRKDKGPVSPRQQTPFPHCFALWLEKTFQGVQLDPQTWWRHCLLTRVHVSSCGRIAGWQIPASVVVRCGHVTVPSDESRWKWGLPVQPALFPPLLVGGKSDLCWWGYRDAWNTVTLPLVPVHEQEMSLWCIWAITRFLLYSLQERDYSNRWNPGRNQSLPFNKTPDFKRRCFMYTCTGGNDYLLCRRNCCACPVSRYFDPCILIT